MSKIIGHVTKIDGAFKALIDGESRELSLGAPVYEGEKIVGSGNPNNFITIGRQNSSHEIKIAGNEPLLFDASLNEEGFKDEELTFDDDNYLDDMSSALEDVDERDTASGEDVEREKNEDSRAKFDNRTGDEEDINSGLGDAKFQGDTQREEKTEAVSQTYTDLEKDIPKSNPQEVINVVLEPVKIVNIISDVQPDRPVFVQEELVITPVVPIGEDAEISISGVTTVKESGSAHYTLSVTKAPLNDLDVNVRISHISTDNGDVTSKIVNVVIASGSNTGSFVISNINNEYAEPDEVYKVEIIKTKGGGYGNLVITEPMVETTIIDTSNGVNGQSGVGPTLLLSGDNSIEEGSSGLYTLSIDVAPATDLVMSVVVGHTTTIAGDIIDLTQSVTIQAGSKSTDFHVRTTSDDLFEGVENFTLNVVSITGGGYEIDPTIPSSLTIGIYDAGDAPGGDGDDVDIPGQPLIDDDRPRFSVADVNISEGGLMTFTVTRFGDANAVQSVDFTTSILGGDTAQSTDFTTNSGTLTFAIGVKTQTLTVQTTQDVPYEGAETFSVLLSNNSAGSSLADAVATGTILDDGTGAGPFNPGPNADDDRPGFSIGDVSISEGGLMTFTITRAGDASEAQSVDFATSILATDTAEADDFRGNSGTITFASGITQQTFTVQTTQDAIYEGGETFTVTLSNSSVGSFIVDGVAIGTILDDGTGAGPFNPGPNADDDRPGFSIGDVSVSEGGLMTFTVIRTGDSRETQSVDFTTGIAATDTAESADYTDTNGTLTFATGVTSQTFKVQTTQDTPYEGAETFSATLSNATGGATIADAVATGTILDDGTGPEPFNPGPNADDDRVGFSIGDVSISEGGLMTFTVTRAGEAVDSQSVDFTTGIGVTDTAEQADFTPTQGTLTFATGVTSQTLTIQTTQDAVYEGSETFSVTLSNNSAGSTIADGVAIGTILDDGTGVGPFNPGPNADDDKPIISIAPTSVGSTDVIEPNYAFFTLTRTGSTEIASSVDISLVHSNVADATSDADFLGTLQYQDISGSWLDATGDIPMSVTTSTIDIRIATNADALLENTENFSVDIVSATNMLVDTNNKSAAGTVSDVPKSLVNDTATVDEKAMSIGSQSNLTTEIVSGNLLANDIKQDIPADGKITKISIDGVNTTVTGVSTTVTTAEGNTLVVNTDSTSATFGEYIYTLNNRIHHVDTLVSENYEYIYDGSWGTESNSDGISVGIVTVNGSQMLLVPQRDVTTSGGTVFTSDNSAHKVFKFGSQNASSDINIEFDLDFNGSGLENDGSEFFDVYINNVLVEHYSYVGVKNIHMNYSAQTDANGDVEVKFVNLANSGAGSESAHIDNFEISTLTSENHDLFQYTVEGSNFSSSATLDVTITDDIPHIQDTAEAVVVGSNIDTNLLLVIDRSSSMEAVINGKNYMQWMTESLQNMIQKYDNLGNVKIKIVGFWAGTDVNGDSVTEQVNAYDHDGYSYTNWISVSDALSYLAYDVTLDKQANSDAGQIFYYTGTWFDNGINTAINQFNKTEADSFNADQTIAYFLSDGAPTTGHKGDTVAWNDFVDNNVDSSVAVMFGDGTSSTSANQIMNEMANPGDAIIVGDVNDLNAVLVDSVYDVEGSIEGMSGTSDIVFGADDGHIESVVYNGTKYLYDANSIDQTIVLTYGKIDINFNTGGYTYRPLVHTDMVEKLTINIVDKDSDVASAELTLNITHKETTPTSVNQVVAMNPNSTDIIEASNFGFHDTDGDSLAKVKITNVNLVNSGHLLYKGVDVVANQEITKADLDAGNLVFNAGNTTGLNYDSFQFKVSDGKNYSTIEKTFTYNVGKTLNVSTDAHILEGDAAIFKIEFSSSRVSSTKIFLQTMGTAIAGDDYIEQVQYETSPGVWVDAPIAPEVDGLGYSITIAANETVANVRVNTISENPVEKDGGEELSLNVTISPDASGDTSDMANLQVIGSTILDEKSTNIIYNSTVVNEGNAQDSVVVGDDILIFKTTGENIDFSSLGNDKIKNIEQIDLNRDVDGANGVHTLSNLSLADVVALTDSNNELKIVGDNSDSVTLVNTDWNNGVAGTGVDTGFTVYTGSDNDTVIKIDQDINTTII